MGQLRPLSVAAAVLFVFAACIAGPRGSKGSSDRKVVVVGLEGRVQGELTRLVDDRYDLVAEKSYLTVARALDAKQRSAPNVSRVANRLDADAVVFAELERAGHRTYSLRLRVHEGKSGKMVRKASVKLKGRMITGSTRRDVERELFPIIDRVKRIRKQSRRDARDEQRRLEREERARERDEERAESGRDKKKKKRDRRSDRKKKKKKKRGRNRDFVREDDELSDFEDADKDEDRSAKRKKRKKRKRERAARDRDERKSKRSKKKKKKKNKKRGGDDDFDEDLIDDDFQDEEDFEDEDKSDDERSKRRSREKKKSKKKKRGDKRKKRKKKKRDENPDEEFSDVDLKVETDEEGQAVDEEVPGSLR